LIRMALRQDISGAMTNRFGVVLHDESVRWAAAEGVSETVIAAVLLLHQRSVEEIVAKLGAVELEQVIKLVGRSPRVYPLGTLDTLKQRKALISPPPSDTFRTTFRLKSKCGALSTALIGRAGGTRTHPRDLAVHRARSKAEMVSVHLRMPSA
jgi:hypothetical protein